MASISIRMPPSTCSAGNYQNFHEISSIDVQCDNHNGPRDAEKNLGLRLYINYFTEGNINIHFVEIDHSVIPELIAAMIKLIPEENKFKIIAAIAASLDKKTDKK